MRRTILLIAIVALWCAWPNAADAKIRVVASTSDLAYLARTIGGDHVDVDAIASPTADVHFVEVRPSFMVKVKKADLVLKVGMELDLWMDRIIDGSRNANLKIVDCSRYIEPLQVPTFKADARYGDLHRFGNPHYWLSPENLEPITRAVVEGLETADPEHAQTYWENRDAFLAEVDAALPALRESARPLAGVQVIFYHNSWPYFNALVGTVAAGFVEPYPGVAPSPSHVANTIELVRKLGIHVIAVEPYFDKRVPEKIASETGAKVITLYPSIGGRDKAETYLEWLQGNIDALKGALP
jgi:ABC-type Zn uptake system ZnuABC Zn-binding protein ZnuA